MKGILTFFINMQEDSKEDPRIIVDVLRDVNKDLFEKITLESGYHIAFFPTFKEAANNSAQVVFAPTHIVFSSKRMSVLSFSNDKMAPSHGAIACPD